MDKSYIKEILERVAQGKVKPEEAMESLKTLPFEDLGFACIDEHRNLRTGQAEVIFGQGKTPEQIAAIAVRMARSNARILVSRTSGETFQIVRESLPHAVYHEEARMIIIEKKDIEPEEIPKAETGPNAAENGIIAVLTAGTADIPVAEEAAVTAEFFGNSVERIYDVGVAGIHRLFNKLDRIRASNVIIVAAGMEGALASVVGGLTERPVIAVPTSIGYGAGFGGVAALLTMLNSCAAGIAVVNIDNGYGAACLASKINQGR